MSDLVEALSSHVRKIFSAPSAARKSRRSEKKSNRLHDRSYEISRRRIKVCSRLIEYSFYILFFLVPLVMTPLNYELFEFNKMVFVYLLTIVIVGSWLIKMVLQKRILFRRTFMDIPFLIFLISQFLSLFFSIDRHTSFWGYYSRFHGGLASTICYVLLYWALVSNVTKTQSSKVPPEGRTGKSQNYNLKLESKQTIKYLYALLASGFLVASYGILEHFGIDKDRWVQDVQNRVFSTLGQPNWLAAWLVAIIPLTWGLALKPKIKNKNSKTKTQKRKNFKSVLQRCRIPDFTFYILHFTFYICLLYTKSRSGLLGFGVAFAVFWGLVFWLNRPRSKQILRPFFIFTFSILLFTFLIGSPWTPNFGEIISGQGKQVVKVDSRFTVSESGNIRQVVWQGAVDIFRNHPVLGTGPETFAYSYYWYRPRAHNDLSEWDFLYNKAHNEYLNFLATTGLVGLGSYLLVIGIFLFWNLKTLIQTNKKRMKTNKKKFAHLLGFVNIRLNSRKKGVRSDQSFMIIIALLSGYASILTTNFFGFSVVAVALLFFLYPALAVAFTTKEQKSLKTKKQNNLELAPWQWVAIGIVLLFTFYLLHFTFKYWYADTLFARGEKLTNAGDHEEAVTSLEKAVVLRPSEPAFHNQLAYSLGHLAMSILEKDDKDLAAELADIALSESNRALNTSPYNLNFWKNRTRILYQLAEIDEKYDQEALASLLRASELAPTDAKVFYNLALLYARFGQDQTAIETLKHTIYLRSNYADARFALALFWEKEGKIDEAKEQLKYILQKINPDYGPAREKLGELPK